jgi:hypothetical protein
VGAKGNIQYNPGAPREARAAILPSHLLPRISPRVALNLPGTLPVIEASSGYQQSTYSKDVPLVFAVHDQSYLQMHHLKK